MSVIGCRPVAARGAAAAALVGAVPPLRPRRSRQHHPGEPLDRPGSRRTLHGIQKAPRRALSIPRLVPAGPLPPLAVSPRNASGGRGLCDRKQQNPKPGEGSGSLRCVETSHGGAGGAGGAPRGRTLNQRIKGGLARRSEAPACADFPAHGARIPDSRVARASRPTRRPTPLSVKPGIAVTARDHGRDHRRSGRHS
jgi:hypothetical protein